MRNQSGRRLPNWAIGLIMVLALAVASYVAFTKQVPWGGGTEFKVTFNSAQNLRPNSPVRVAGVEVGKVTKVEPLSASGDEEAETASSGSAPTGAVVTMEIDEDGLPWKEDANFTLKPRLFLEGNLFVDVQPGSPSSPPVEEGYNFPPSQTQNTVQLDEVLTGAFQADARKNLQIFLDQFGEALIDEGGADSLRTLNKVSPGAYRYTAEVNQAILGQNPHDLSELIFNLDRVIKGLDRNEPALLDLVTNLRITDRQLRRSGRRPRGGGRGASLHARRRNHRLRQPQRLVPAAARLRPRGSARGPLDPRDARGHDPAPASAPRPRPARRAPRPRRRPASRRAEPRPADARDDPVPEAEPQACELLQPHDPPLGERPRRLDEPRPTTRATPRRAESSRRPATGSPGSPGRAARATPTASTSA